MIPSFRVPSGVSLPDAMPIPSVPYRFPPLGTPRWTPIVKPLPQHQMMEAPNVPQKEEEFIEEKPEPKPKPKPRPTAPVKEQKPVAPKPVIDKQEQVEDEPAEITAVEIPLTIEVPFIGSVPVPPAELLVTAGTTAAVAASVSVVAALSATTLMNYLLKLFKPLIKFIMKRILKRKNKYTTSWARQRRLDRSLRPRK